MKKSITLALLSCYFTTTINSTTINSSFHRTENIETTPLNEIGFNNNYSKESCEIKKLNTDINSLQYFGTEDLRPKFRIGFNAPQIDHRQLLLTIDENTTDGFDWGYDAEIYEIFEDDMYWLIDQKKYVIQATNSATVNKEIPLGIITAEGGTISITVDAIENPIEGITIYLKDKELNQIYNIQQTPYEITLSAGEYHNKYAIVFLITDSTENDDLSDEDSSDEMDEENSNNDFNESPALIMYPNNTNATICINNKDLIQINGIILYSTTGQKIQYWKKNLNSKFLTLNTNKQQQGIYLIKATTEKGIITKRILINSK